MKPIKSMWIIALFAGCAIMMGGCTEKIDENDGQNGTDGTVTVDKTELQAEIAVAENMLASAETGTAPGQYPEDAVTTFENAINSAKSVNENEAATQEEVNDAVTELKNAEKTFKDSVIIEVETDKSALETAVSEANSTLNDAEVGNEPGQYPQEAADVFAAAIANAQAVLDNESATQEEIDEAVTMLASAQETFLSAQVPSDLALWLPFSGSAEDMSDYGHAVTLMTGETGQPQPSLTTDRLGAPDQAYAFNGGFMSIPYHSSLNAPTMSVMYWMCQNELSPVDMATISLGWWDCWMGKTIGGAQNEIAFQAGVPVQSGVMIETGRWYHVAISRSETSLDIYVDGELKNTQAATGPMAEYTSQPLRIGALSENPGAYYPFIGSLDEIRVYTKALSAEEIKAIYDQERP